MVHPATPVYQLELAMFARRSLVRKFRLVREELDRPSALAPAAVTDPLGPQPVAGGLIAEFSMFDELVTRFQARVKP